MNSWWGCDSILHCICSSSPDLKLLRLLIRWAGILFFISICTTVYKWWLRSWMEHLKWGDRSISVAVDLRFYLTCFSVPYGARKICLFRVSGITFFTIVSQDLDFSFSSVFNSQLILLSIRASQDLMPTPSFVLILSGYMTQTKHSSLLFSLLLELHQTVRGQSWTFLYDYTENQ